MSKYKPTVLEILSETQIKSTNEILKELEERSGRKINWHMVYRILAELQGEGKAERLEAKIGFFWRKKK